MSSLIDSKTKGQNVICQICHQVRNYKKYRRHLRFHFRRGEVSLTRTNEILFLTKKHRCRTRYSVDNSSMSGRICSLLINGIKCGAITIDLSAHLTKYHGISKNGDNYRSIMKSAGVIHKDNVIYMDNSGLIVNSTLHNYKSPYFLLNERNAIEAYSSHTFTPIASPSSETPINFSDEFSYYGDSDGKSEQLHASEHLYSHVKTSIYVHMFQEIVNFKLFLNTILGGCKSSKSIEMDISNIYIILNSIGEKDLWNPVKLNSYISEEMNRRAPTTSHGRLKSIRRFFDFLKIHNSALLPDSRTPIFRKALAKMEIVYPGTITDLRKASATLTGKFCPQMHDVMSLFMGHSRNTHENNYRIHLGHDGLINAFMALEKMQSQPHSTKLEFPFLTNKLATSPICDRLSTCEISKSFTQDGTSPLDFNSSIKESNSKYDINHSTLIAESSSSDHSDFSLNFKTSRAYNVVSVESPHTGKATKSRCRHSSPCSLSDFSNFDKQSENNNIFQCDNASNCSEIYASDLNSTQTKIVNDVTVPIFTSSSTSVDEETFCDFVCSKTNLDCPTPSSHNYTSTFLGSKISIQLKLRGCNVSLVKLTSIQNKDILGDTTALIHNRHLNVPKDTFICHASDSRNSEYLLLSKTEKKLFLNVYSYFIDKVSKKIPISKREVINFALSCSKFRPLLDRMRKTIYSDALHTKIYNKVRIIGNSNHSQKFHLILSSSIVCPIHYSHHKKYFYSRKR